MAMSHFFEFQQIRAVLDLPYLEKIDVAVPTNLKCGNCSEDAVERLHELGGKSPQDRLDCLGHRGAMCGLLRAIRIPNHLIEPGRLSSEPHRDDNRIGVLRDWGAFLNLSQLRPLFFRSIPKMLPLEHCQGAFVCRTLRAEDRLNPHCPVALYRPPHSFAIAVKGASPSVVLSEPRIT